MNRKRWVVMGIVVAVFRWSFESIVNHVFLGKSYEATATLWRPLMDMKMLFPYGFVTTLITSYILVYIYHRGYEGKGEQARGGASLWPRRRNLHRPADVRLELYYVTDASLDGHRWFLTGFFDMLIAGALIGLMYKRAV